MPLICLEVHAALMHCAGYAESVLSEQTEAEQGEGDQARLERYERGVFKVTDRDLNDVPPYQNDEFTQPVQRLAASSMCERHRQLRRPPQWTPTQLVDATGVRGSIPSAASSIPSPVELSPDWIACIMNGLRAQYSHLH